jgi:hypothetical protein
MNKYRAAMITAGVEFKRFINKLAAYLWPIPTPGQIIDRWVAWLGCDSLSATYRWFPSINLCQTMSPHSCEPCAAAMTPVLKNNITVKPINAFALFIFFLLIDAPILKKNNLLVKGNWNRQI